MSEIREDLNQRETKRPKYDTGQSLVQTSTQKAFTHANYTVGWICPLQIELIAALEMLDEEHAKLPQQPTDHNVYHLGSISGHNVVIAGMWQAGNPTAASVVAQMRMTFPNIRFGLLVGIGGGVPVMTEQGMVRLGHVVVSKPTGQSSGAIQYDRGKAEDGKFVRTGALAPPPPVLLLAADSLGAKRARSRVDPLLQNIQRIDTSLPGLRNYRFPGKEKDFLFPAEYKHLRPRASCEVSQCDISQRIPRDEDDMYEADEWITVHRGTIASGEIVVKDAEKRDLLSQDSGALCFEMECAGALSDFPCLVIRGISDYCDTHKNDRWHGFASAAAAAYARQLFFHMPIDQSQLISADDPGIRRVVGRSDDEERHKIMEWIPSTNYIASQHGIFSRICQGTGQWLLETSEFRGWVDKEGVLFCPGIPGAGKSTLSSIVINHLQEAFVNNPNVAVAYTFCDYRENTQQKLNNVLGAILKQLIQQMDELPDQLKTLYESHQGNGPPLQAHQLLDLLISTACLYSRAYLIIDALDECPGSDGTRREVINNILKLQESANIHVFATSRFIPDITASFEKFPSVEIRASDADVALYAEGRVHEFSCVRKNLALSQLVVSSITKTSDGMFLLAKLYLDSLKGESSIKAIKTALSKFQSGSGAYDDAYGKALERIDHQIAGQASLARRMLTWLTFAQRSLTLTELQHALAVEIGQSFFDEENLSDIEDMISACAGLVTYNDESHLITLVHYTAKEYFERESCSLFPHAHRDMGTICVTYLCFDSFESGRCELDEDYKDRCRRFPLYKYASSNWGHHARREQMDQELIFSLLENEKKLAACAQSLIWTLGGYNAHFRTWISRNTAAIHLTVEFGLLSETDSLLKRGHDVNVRSKFFDIPIILATKHNREDMVRILVHHGARPGDLTKREESIVSISAREGNVTLLILALELGVNLDFCDWAKRSPLSHAAENGHLKVVEILLNAKADMEIEDHAGWTALSWAASFGREDVVHLLLEAGAHPNPRASGCLDEEHDGHTPLSLAAEIGHKEIVRLLLQGNDPDEPDNNGRTPLSWAAQNGHVDIVRILLAAGAIIDRFDAPKDAAETARSGLRRTPLGWAMNDSQQAVVELLLKEGANPLLQLQVISLINDDITAANMYWQSNEPFPPYGADISIWDRFGDNKALSKPPSSKDDIKILRLLIKHVSHTAKPKNSSVRDDLLLWAAGKGHTLLIEMLLEEGIDIDTRDPQNGDCALSCAAVNNHEGSVALLIKKGACVDVRNWNGQTALSKAAQQGNEAIVRLLLETCANIESRDTFGQTPLFHALKNGGKAVIELLLMKDPTRLKISDEFGRSALLIASENRLDEVVRLTGETRQRSEILASELAVVLSMISSPQYHSSRAKMEELLLWAAKYGHMEVIESLSGSIVGEFCEDVSGAKALSLAVRNGRIDAIELLLKKGVPPDAEDDLGYSPLSWAFIIKNESAACFLLSRGADPHKPIEGTKGSELHHPPLLWAAKQGFKRTVRLLLQMKADPNYYDWTTRHTSTPHIETLSVLSSAVNNGNHGIVETLLNHGIENDLCHSGLMLAIWLFDRPLVSLILRKGIQNRWLVEEYGEAILLCAAYAGYDDVVRQLLKAGISANVCFPDSLLTEFSFRRNRTIWGRLHGVPVQGENTPLRLSAREGHEAVVRVLLENQADANYRSPLKLAIKNDHRPVVEILLQYGAKIDAQEDGLSLLLRPVQMGHVAPLKFLLTKILLSKLKTSDQGRLFLEAVSRQHIDIVRLLLEERIDPNLVDKIGRNGLMLAAEKKQPDIVELLLDYNASAEPADCLGRTPIFFAAARGDIEIVKILLEKASADPQRTTCAGRSALSLAHDFQCHTLISLLEGQENGSSCSEELDANVPFLSGWICDTCNRALSQKECFFRCAICKNHEDGPLDICIECVSGDLGCYDRLHSLERLIVMDSEGKLTTIDKTARWRHGHELPIRPLADL